MLPEAAEAHLPLQSKNKETDTKSENNTESSVHIQPAHLNGSLKSAALEEIDEMNNKIDVVNTATVDEEEHRHSLWKWPAGQGKFTQVQLHRVVENNVTNFKGALFENPFRKPTFFLNLTKESFVKCSDVIPNTPCKFVDGL